MEKTARTALKEVREAIGGYRSQGLVAEVEMARNTLQTAGVALACEEIEGCDAREIVALITVAGQA